MNKKFKIALITIAITVVLVVAAVLIASLIKPDMPAKQTSLPSADVSGTAVTDVPEETLRPSMSTPSRPRSPSAAISSCTRASTARR